MDLTKNYPRSVHEEFAGVVQIGRTSDKARAHVAGTLGEYHYNCPMDKAVFEFLGIDDHEAYAREVAQRTDRELAAWLRKRYISKKPYADIRKWNESWLKHGPEPGSESQTDFIELRNQLAPDRTDVTSWADLLDLDEGRTVLRKTAA